MIFSVFAKLTKKHRLPNFFFKKHIYKKVSQSFIAVRLFSFKFILILFQYLFSANATLATNY
jgi:hypothetical protein